MSNDVASPLSDSELEAAVADLDGWACLDGKLHKEFVFDGFVAAFGFITSAALIAERVNHHPEWSNIYNKVWIDLVTHDAGGVTRLDTEFARELDQLARSHGQR
jgi:4a-hydroxytetrahydrobiopterin dehydratase